MADPLRFHYATVTGTAWPQLAVAVRERVLPQIDESGGAPYGLFAPQFGLASNQLVVMTAWPVDVDPAGPMRHALDALGGASEVDGHVVSATARPATAMPPERPGVYVHRFFDLDPAAVTEVVELSSVAWETFEATFDVEVIGLFLTERGPDQPAELMLLNRYPTLAAWEESRNFDRDPESRARFERRAALTTGTRAITTSLLTS